MNTGWIVLSSGKCIKTDRVAALIPEGVGGWVVIDGGQDGWIRLDESEWKELSSCRIHF